MIIEALLAQIAQTNGLTRLGVDISYSQSDQSRRFSATAWADDLGSHGCAFGGGDTVADALADLINVCTQQRAAKVAASKIKAEISEPLSLLQAVQGLGAMPEGYCFCSKGRISDDSKAHEPECLAVRAAIAKADMARDDAIVGGAA